MNEHLQEGFDPSSVTVSSLRSIFRLHGIPISRDITTKAKLVNLFNEKIAANRTELSEKSTQSGTLKSSRPKSENPRKASRKGNSRARVDDDDSEEKKRFGGLPLELQLYVWSVLADSINSDSSLSKKQRERFFRRLLFVNKQWYHTFAKQLFSDEVRVAKVMSNNLNDTSSENAERIEKYYAFYVTTIEHIGTDFHKNYELFWKCLEVFDFKIQFPNVRTLKIATGKYLNC